MEVVSVFDGKRYVVSVSGAGMFPPFRVSGARKHKVLARAFHKIGEELDKIGDAEEHAFIWPQGKGR